MWFLHRLSIVSIWVKKFCNVHSILFQPYKYQNVTNAQKRQYFLLKRVNTHYDEMKLLEIRDWKIEILLITAKTGFYSLVFHMLASYIGPKVPKDFCDIPTWQITRKLIVINSYKQLFQGHFCDFTKYHFLYRYLFKTFNRKFFLQISKHI